MTFVRTNLTRRLVLALALLVGLGGCSIGDGSGVTYPTALTESLQSAPAPLSSGTEGDD